MARIKTEKKQSILEMAKVAVPPSSGQFSWLDELKRSNHESLSEVLDLLDDWMGGREYTASHTRSSLTRFLCSLDFCSRKSNHVYDLIRKVEIHEIKTTDYR